MTSGPYARALGASADALHPRLRAYFATIPPGQVGVGVGTFDVVGTPRRRLWPMLAVLARWGILFPGFHRDVPFTVRNTPTASGSVAAERRFEFTVGARTMSDLVAFRGGRLIDVLGPGGEIRVALDARASGGALELRSTAVGVRLGRLRLRIPPLFAPRVRLTERFDDALDRQCVAFTLDAPLLGRLYEYSGSFRYEIRAGGQS